MKEKFLPIGTVVLLKGGKNPIMITAYYVFSTASKDKVYDYVVCPYPFGIIDPNTVHAFNHDMIEKILYEGYESKESKELSKNLIEKQEKIIAKIQEKNKK